MRLLHSRAVIAELVRPFRMGQHGCDVNPIGVGDHKDISNNCLHIYYIKTRMPDASSLATVQLPPVHKY